jgi:hypothetical protein
MVAPLRAPARALTHSRSVDDEALLARQAELQDQATTVVDSLRLVDVLGKAGRVVPLGSSVTGLMVWRDLDFGVDARGLSTDAAWETMRPLLGRCSSLRYLDDRDERRHYFVMHIDDWKIDVSLWTSGMPPFVESFQTDLIERLTDELRITILRLKDAWCTLPVYPEIVSAWQIYDAVLDYDVRTFEQLDAYLVERGFPARSR